MNTIIAVVVGVILFFGAARPFSPMDIDGMVFWMDASGVKFIKQ